MEKLIKKWWFWITIACVILVVVLGMMKFKEQKQLEDMKPSETAEFVLSYIYQHPEEFEIYFFKEPMMDKIYEMGLPRDTEMEILAAAIDYETRYHPDEMILITDNLYLYNVANLFFGDGVIQTHYN